MTKKEISDEKRADAIRKRLKKRFPPKENETWGDYEERTDKPKSEYLARILKTGKKILHPKTKEIAGKSVVSYSTEITDWSGKRGWYGITWLPSKINYKMNPEKNEDSAYEIAEYIQKVASDKYGPRNRASHLSGETNHAFFNVGQNVRITHVASKGKYGVFVIEGSAGKSYREAVYAFKKENGTIKVSLLERDMSSADEDPHGFFRYVVNDNDVSNGKLKLNKLRKPKSNDEIHEYDLEEILGSEHNNKSSGSSRLYSILAIVGISAGFLFLSPNLTGNAIASLSSTNSNWIAGISFIVGIGCALFYFKNKK
ncbi:MAG: hypothetical protein AABX03_03315 [Nanoarchaeota archaeon]